MAGGFEDFQPHSPELNPIAVGQLLAGKLGVGPPAKVDRRADLVPQFDVAGDEVGVEVRQKHMLDREAASGGIGEVLVDVPLRVDHCGRLGLFVGDQIGRVRETGEVVLLDLHGIRLRGGRRGDRVVAAAA